MAVRGECGSGLGSEEEREDMMAGNKREKEKDGGVRANGKP